MSPQLALFSCSGCDSFPLRNKTRCCKVCFDFHPCETCFEGLDAIGMMPSGHTKEHSMVAFELFYNHKFPSRFNKPVDPQWSYQVTVDFSCYGFMWEKKEPLQEILNTSHMSVLEDDSSVQTSTNAVDDNPCPISKLETNEINLKWRSFSAEQTSKTTQQNWSVRLLP
uniref:ZZ-type domain-containing protein n=1 Tax=Physcomitrium patens TaxID=3218 RepID=A0A2K1KZP1_PHYPA|nr:hypothetical protein PHYPA_002035 [Physcomitrium patens]